MKMLGAVLILFSTTAVGFLYAKKLTERTRQLRQLKTALQSLEAEIMYGFTPLAEASENLAKQLPAPVAYFFETFATHLKNKEASGAQAWERALIDCWHLTSLSKTEFEIMHQFGQSLGQTDRPNQQKQIKLTLTHLEREEMEARDRQTRYEKMYKSLGFLSGLLIILLMM